MQKSTAVYIRASSAGQTDEHQHESIDAWLADHNIPTDDVERYVDLDWSGYKDDRPQFQALLTELDNGNLDRIVCWELSRVSRRGATLQEFLDTCEDTDTTVVVTDGAIEKIKPDGTGRFVADVIGMVYQQERRQLIRRVEAGIKRAKNEGKWVGNLPAGFRRDENGYLQPIIDPDDGEDGFLEIRDALRRVEEGDSYRSVAGGLSMTRQGLAKIHKDDTRQSWYFDGDADDDRVQGALNEVDVGGAD